MRADLYVCPRCGRTVEEEHQYCSSCGLELASQYQLPTSAEWLARQQRRPSWPGDRPDTTRSSNWADTPTPRAPLPTTTATMGRYRSLPGIMLGSGASVLAGSALLASIGALLYLIFAVNNDASAGYSAGYGFQLLSGLFLVAGFAMAGIAFLGRRPSRAARLGMGALLVAGGFFALAAADQIRAATSTGSATDVASEATLGVGALLLLVVAILAASGLFSTADRSGLQPLRDGRLAWASTCLAVGLGFLMTGEILTAISASSAGPVLGAYASGSGVIAAGWGVGIGAAVVAAVGFVTAQHRLEGWRRRRDLLLAVASVVFAVAFLLLGIGGMLRASAVSDIGGLAPPGVGFGQVEASYWLTGVGQLVLIAAAVCAAVGFFFAWHLQRATPVSVPEGPRASTIAASPMPDSRLADELREGVATRGLAQECSSCGYQNQPGAMFCRRCGTHLVRRGA